MMERPPLSGAFLFSTVAATQHNLEVAPRSPRSVKDLFTHTSSIVTNRVRVIVLVNVSGEFDESIFGMPAPADVRVAI